jgi:hypothetical protein
MTLRRHQHRTHNAKLGLEWLENRSTMAADTAMEGIITAERAVFQELLDKASQNPIQIHRGPTTATFQSPERAVVGFDPLEMIEVEAVPLSDGGHVLLSGRLVGDVGLGNVGQRIEIEAHHTNADGQPGASFPVVSIPVSFPLGLNQRLILRAVPLGEGGFAIFYADATGIHGSRYAADGTSEGSPMDWVFSHNFDSPNFDVATTHDGFLVVATSYGSQPLLKVRSLGESDSDSFTELLLPVSTDTNIQRLRIEPLDGDRFGVSWIESGTSPVTNPTSEQGSPQSANQQPARWQFREIAGSSVASSMEYDLSGFSGTPLVAVRRDGTTMFVGVPQSPQSPRNETDLKMTLLARDGSQVDRILAGAAFAEEIDEFSLAMQRDGSFALIGFRPSEIGEDLLTSFYSATGERLGDDLLVQSFSGFDRRHAGILPLQGGGYTMVWTGPALEASLQAILAKTLRLGETPVSIQLGSLITAPESVIQIDGISEEFGFNIGERTSPTVWQIPASALQGLSPLRMQGLSKLASQAWTVSLLGPSGPEATARVVWGTAASETLPSLPRGRIHGEAGIDTLVVESIAEAARVKRISDNMFFLADVDELTGYLLDQIEQVQFIDEVLSMDELLDLTEEAWNPPGSLPEPTTPPITSDLLGGPNHGLIFQPHTGPMASTLPPRLSGLPVRSDVSAPPRQNSTSRRPIPHPHTDTEGLVRGTHDIHRGTNNSPLEVVLGLPILTTQTFSLSLDSGNAQPDEPQILTTASSRSASLLRASFRHDVGILAPTVSVPLANLQTRTEETPTILEAMPVRRRNLAPFTTNSNSIATSFDSEKLFQAFDEVDSTVAVEARQEVELVVGTAMVIAAGYSVAQLAWLVRGSVLLTKAMSSLPIWMGFDPLPILDPHWRGLNSAAESKESLLDIVRAN